MEQATQTFPQFGSVTSAEIQKLLELLRIAYEALEANNQVVSYTLHFHESPHRATMLQAQGKYLSAQLTRQQAGISFEAGKDELGLDFTEIGQRLKQYREEAHIAGELAAQVLGSTSTHLEEIEAGTTANGGHELFLLAQLYKRQVFEIVQGSLPYQMPDEILAAWDRSVISEGVTVHTYGVSIVEAQAMLRLSKEEGK